MRTNGIKKLPPDYTIDRSRLRPAQLERARDEAVTKVGDDAWRYGLTVEHLRVLRNLRRYFRMRVETELSTNTLVVKLYGPRPRRRRR